MAHARRAWLTIPCGGVLIACAVGVALSACGNADIVDDELPVGLPDRTPVQSANIEAGSDDAVAPSDVSSPTPQDAGADAFAATQAAILCGAPNLALCFAFEGVVHDGSPSALVPSVSGVTFGPGKVGQAAIMSSASYIRFAASPAFELTTATIEAWVKMSPNPVIDGVILDDDNRTSLTILPDGTVQCVPNSSPATAKIAVDVWTHVACVFDGANVHVYVAGDEVITGAGVIGSSPTSTAAVGGNAPSGEPFVGAIDSLRIFKVARTAAEIAAAAGK